MRIQGHPPFENRIDAGSALAKALAEYHIRDAVIFAIPRGGIPVAVEVALKMGIPLDIVVPRKIPIPGNPEAGYGAVTEDGMVVLNEPLVAQLRITEPAIKRQAQEVTTEIRRRLALYRKRLGPSGVEGRTAIIIDDGIASGYTMLAAVKSLRRRGAARVVAAAPVSSSHAYELVKSSADDVVAPIVSAVYPFAVAEFYRYWHDLTDEEVIDELERYGKSIGRNTDDA